MKNTLIKIASLCSLALVLSACDNRNFDEINTDTSKILNPTAGSLLPPLQYNMASVGYLRSNDFNFDIMQNVVDFPNEGNTLSRYFITENTGNGFWNNSYKWLKQTREMYNAALAQNNANYQAVALVMNAWIYSNLTDTFGDVPFSEASRVDEGITQPKFDKQKDIYVKLLNDLKAANSLFDLNKSFSDADLIYNANGSSSNVLKWKKFCNTLSLRLLTRILKKNGEVDVYTRINEIVNNPTTYPIMTSKDDTAGIDLSGTAPLLPPIARPQDFTTSRAVGEFFMETLKANNDPRLSMFFTQAKDLATNANIGYKGVPAGYAQGTVFNYQPSNVNQNLAKAPMKLLILPYAELQFILAELSLKGIISGNAQTYYENGVKSAIEQWNSVVPSNYFANPNVAYDGTLERIMLQKYVALFFVDQQQWFEKKRTGFPFLPNNGGLLNDGKLPQRLMYPTQSRILNTTNYNAAAQSIGGDNINTKVWWGL